MSSLTRARSAARPSACGIAGFSSRSLLISAGAASVCVSAGAVSAGCGLGAGVARARVVVVVAAGGEREGEGGEEGEQQVSGRRHGAAGYRRARRGRAGRAASRPRAVSSEPRRLLLVEDDPVVAEVLTAALEGLEDIQLVHEADGRRALVRVSTGGWALVVSDIELPNADGLEILRAAKEADPATPVCSMTAHEKLDYAIEAVRGHADEFMVKPVDPHDLRRKVAALLAGPRAGGRQRSDGAGDRSARRRRRDRLRGHPGRARRGGRPRDDPGARRGRRRRGARRTSAGALGVELLQRDLPAGGMTEGGDTLHAITNTIERLRPDVVYTHSIDDDHQDRRSVHRATVVVVALGVEPVRVPVRDRRAWASPPGASATSTLHIPQKLRALRAFESLRAARPELDEELVLATARYWSRFGAGRHVEPLEVVRESETPGSARVVGQTRLEQRPQPCGEVGQAPRVARLLELSLDLAGEQRAVVEAEGAERARELVRRAAGRPRRPGR